MCLLIDSRLGLQPTAHSSWSVNSLSYMLMDLLYKWPAPAMVEKNSSVQHTNRQSCVHIAPAVLFMSQPQLEMHFDDSQFFCFFSRIFKNVWYAQHSFFFQEICGGCSDIKQSGNVWKNHKWLKSNIDCTFSFLGLISHWSCNSASRYAYTGSIYPPKASSILHVCKKKTPP